eukprot:gene2590-2892_t
MGAKPADVQPASRARHQAEHAHHDFLDVWSSRARDLKELGVGHMLYFYFLKWMAFLFAGLSLLTALPNMALNISGKYFDAGFVELSTLGNFGRLSISHGWQKEVQVSDTFMADAALAPATSPINKASAIIVMSVLDLFGCLAYFCTTMWLIVVARKLAHDADVQTITIHDYSIRVVHVEMVRAYGTLLRLVMRRGQLMQQLQAAIAGLQHDAMLLEEVPVKKEEDCFKVRDELDVVNEQIQEAQSQAESYRVVGAFVTFKDEAGKLACLRAQPHNRVRQWWTMKPEHKLFGRYALRIEQAPEPSDIKYEHIEHGSFDRFCRAALVASCSYAAFAVGFILISLASAMRFNLARIAGVDTEACDASCGLYDGPNHSLGLTNANRALYLACGKAATQPAQATCPGAQKKCYECYCFKAITGGQLDESQYCTGTANYMALDYISQAVIVVVILGINMLLSTTSRLLTAFEKHHTCSTETRSLAKKLFLFLNSAISTIVASAHLPFLAGLFEGTYLSGLFFQGIYTDLTPNWYKIVGRSLATSQFVAAVLRILNLIIRWLQLKYNEWSRKKCLTQPQLEESLRGPEFQLDTRYGEHLNAIYVAMLLSGGMPITYISAAFWFVSSYWCDKVELLTLSRRPITYGSDLSDMVMNLLPYAAVWHALFALWAFSLFGTPRSRLVAKGFASLILRICQGLHRFLQSVGDYQPEEATERLLAAGAAHLLILLIILVAVLVLKLYLTTWVSAGRWVLSCLGRISDQECTEESGLPDFPLAVRTQLLVGETSYAIQAQPSYAAAFSKTQDVGEVMVQVVMKKGGKALGPAKGTDTAAVANPAVATPRLRQTTPRAGSYLRGTTPSQDGTSHNNDAAPVTAAEVANSQQHQPLQSTMTASSPFLAAPHARRTSSPNAGVGVRPAQKFEMQVADYAHAASSARSSRMVTPTTNQQIDSLSIEQDDQALGGGASSRRGTSDRVALPQRFRQARSSQVLPIPAEYRSGHGQAGGNAQYAAGASGDEYGPEGNGAGLGRVREKELFLACRVLQVPASNVHVLDVAELQDGMGTAWATDVVAREVEQHLHLNPCDVVLTFDSYGVSGHINHRGVHQGVRQLLAAKGLSLGITQAWQLVSEHLVVKYSGLCSLRLLGLRLKQGQLLILGGNASLSLRAMAAHHSQWVWYRKLFVLLSSYTYCNRLQSLLVQ